MVQFGVESENGWRPAKSSKAQCRWIEVPGTKVHLQLFDGAPAKIMAAFAADYNAYIEPLRDPDSAGWTPTNSVATSNHLNGTAMDLNWDSHAFRVRGTFSAEQQETIRNILRWYEDTIFWGGNWQDPIDEMHWQMGYGTFANPKTEDFVRRKIRSDGFSQYRRGEATVPTAVLASNIAPQPSGEKVLQYDRSIVGQETGYWCGPASTQIVLSARHLAVTEAELARIIGTTVNGTDYIGQIEKRALDKYLPEAQYTTVDLPNDPPTQQQTDEFWARLVAAVDGGYGLVMNWVAPASNAPRGIKGSQSPSGYGSHTIYHYVTAMGYAEDNGVKAVWVADPGFRPFGYWITLQQCMTLMPPKGYTYPAAVKAAATTVSAPTAPRPQPAMEVSVGEEERFQSRSIYRDSDEKFLRIKDAVLNIDGMCHAGLIVEPAALRGEIWAIDAVAKLARGKAAGARSWYDTTKVDAWAIARAQSILALIERANPDALRAYITQAQTGITQ